MVSSFVQSFLFVAAQGYKVPVVFDKRLFKAQKHFLSPVRTVPKIIRFPRDVDISEQVKVIGIAQGILLEQGIAKSIIGLAVNLCFQKVCIAK